MPSVSFEKFLFQLDTIILEENEISYLNLLLYGEAV